VSAPVAHLLRAVLRQMVVARLKAAALVLLAVGVFGLAAGLMAHWHWPADPPDAPQAPPAPRPIEGPQPMALRIPDINRTGSPNPSELVNVNGTLFFAADDGVHGRELWKCVLTPDGPKPSLVKDVSPGPAGSDPQFLTNVAGTLFFVPGGIRGRELWKSDGTADGTVLVKRFKNAGVSGAFPQMSTLIAVGKTLFFAGREDTHQALWKSDGTEAGTVIVKDALDLGLSSYYPRNMASVNGTLFFAADDRVHGCTLWKSDGTEGGTVVVKDIKPAPRRLRYPCFLTDVNGTLFFTATDGVHGRELWKSDGTADGTVLVKDVNPGPASAFPRTHVGNLTAVGRMLFFAADDGVHGRKLWKSDGTEAGTVLVKDVSPGTTTQLACLPSTAMADVNGLLCFTTEDGGLWKSDGTEAGTVLVKRIAANRKEESLFALTAVNGVLFCAADNGDDGVELWKSSGTEAGTVLVREINPGRADGLSVRGVGDVTIVGGTLFFVADRPRRRPQAGWVGWYQELWHMPAPRPPADP
jgi:ELWxxDGT repeat protein